LKRESKTSQPARIHAIPLIDLVFIQFIDLDFNMAEGEQITSATATASSTRAIDNVLGDSQVSESEAKRQRLLDLGKSPPPDFEKLLSQFTTAQQRQTEQMLLLQKQQSDAMTAILQQFCAAVQTITPTPHVPEAQPSQPSQPPATHTGAKLAAIPVDLDKIILQRTRSYKDILFKLAKARTHQSKLDADIAKFQDPGSAYPARYRAFKASTTFAELDLALDEAASGEHKFVVDIPPGTSRRDAMALVHRASTAFLVQCQQQGQKEHVATLENRAAPCNLKSIVQEVLAEASKPEHAQVFGLPKPVTLEVSEQAIDARVQSLYSDIYAKLNRKLRVDEEASSKSGQLQNDRDEQLLAMSPDKLLDSLVDKRIAAKLQEAGIAAPDDPMIVGPSTADVTSSQFIDALPGKGQSPPGGVGYTKPRAKAKVQPSPFTSPKDAGKKGKGKGKGKDHNKGKKGKGKERKHLSSSGKGAAATGRGKGKPVA
jgi:hypothetical protein